MRESLHGLLGAVVVEAHHAARHRQKRLEVVLDLVGAAGPELAGVVEDRCRLVESAGRVMVLVDPEVLLAALVEARGGAIGPDSAAGLAAGRRQGLLGARRGLRVLLVEILDRLEHRLLGTASTLLGLCRSRHSRGRGKYLFGVYSAMAAHCTPLDQVELVPVVDTLGTAQPPLLGIVKNWRCGVVPAGRLVIVVLLENSITTVVPASQLFWPCFRITWAHHP